MWSKLLLTASLFTPSNSGRSTSHCPNVHVLAARETFAPAGLGNATKVVDMICNSHPGATFEAIDYPAMGHECNPYSVQKGAQAVADQVTRFVNDCPDTQIVLVGYSQGAHIIDDAMCGGGDPHMGIADPVAPVPRDVGAHVKAMIWMGSPRHTPGAPYNVGSSQSNGFDPRPKGQTCGPYNGIIQSYCDQNDPYCSNGHDEDLHFAYARIYGDDALEFVNSKVD
ncbi:hypothetical protein FE257_004527 [Aspergillus nanangensis]|uniref:Acetylxylan esterase n=1 Tax=Aspergillus nanangensis TaxID=2582783 RepID=A0AAD4CY70_ASPNN|nr:hypothetical protein FE257_004527 [Aspergillus nanangensis]